MNQDENRVTIASLQLRIDELEAPNAQMDAFIAEFGAWARGMAEKESELYDTGATGRGAIRRAMAKDYSRKFDELKAKHLNETEAG